MEKKFTMKASLAAIMITLMLNFCSSSLYAQCAYNETFPSIVTNGYTSFTSNGRVFTVTTNSNASSVLNFATDYLSGTGWTGTAPGNCYIDNYWGGGSFSSTTPNSFTISAASTFTLKSFWIFVSANDFTTLNTSGNVTVVGKNGASTVFTATGVPFGTAAHPGWNPGPFETYYEGFTNVDMAKLGGTDNSEQTITSFTISLPAGTATEYVALEPFDWGLPTDPYPSSGTTNAATSITSSAATLNGSVIPNNSSTFASYATNLLFEYTHTSSTMSSGQTFITATVPSGTSSSSSSTSFSVNATGLLSNTQYWYRAIGANCNDSSFGGIQTFTTLAANTTPTFITSSPTLVVCNNAPATDIKSLLHVSDIDVSQTETWSQAVAPNHGGTLTITSATAASGSSNITPGGTINYTPSSGFSGTETFTMQVSDGTASSTVVVTVTVNPAPTISITGGNSSICAPTTKGWPHVSGTSVNSDTLTASGTATSYTWAPSTGISVTTGATVRPGINGANPPMITSGLITYTVTGTLGGCSSSATRTVSVNPEPASPLLGSTSTVSNHYKGQCRWQSIPSTYIPVPLSASGVDKYTWSPATNLSVTTGANITATPTLLVSYARTYTVTGTTTSTTYPYVSGGGCISKDTVKIEVIDVQAYGNPNENPSVYYFPGQTINMQMVALNFFNYLTGYGLDSLSYTWAPATGISGANSFFDTLNVTPTGTPTYTFTGTYLGCPTDSTSGDTMQFYPVSITGGGTITLGGNTTLTQVGQNTVSNPIQSWAWSPSTGLNNTTAQSVIASPTVTTTYTLTLTDYYGTTATGTVQVSVNAFSVGVTGGATPICTGGAGTSLTGTGATTYTWAPATGLSATTGTTVVANPTITTVYTVTGTTGASVGTATVQVTVNTTPTSGISGGTTPLCSGGSGATLTGSGATTYTWAPNTNISATSGVSVTVTPTATITYTVTGTSSGCSSTATREVTVNTTPSAITGTFVLPTGTVSQLADPTGGGIWLSVSSGVASINSSGLLSGLTAGTSLISYTVSGCSVTKTVTVNAAGALNWYSVTTGGDASVTTNWWSTNSNSGYQPTVFSTDNTTWTFQSNMTSTAPLTFEGNVAIVSGGTFTPQASSTTTVGGNWSNVSGTFTHNSGTVQFNGANTASSSYTLSGSMTGTSAFNHLTFNSATNGYSLGSNAADVSGNFILSAGTLTASSANMNVSGNFTQSSGSFFHPNGGTVTMNGTTSSITAASMTTATTNCFNNLSFNAGSTTTYTINNSLLLMGNLTNLTSHGTIAFGAHTMTIGGNFANPGPAPTGASSIVFNGTTVTASGNR